MIRYDQKLPGTITKAPGSVFLCNRKFRGIPCYIKRHKDAHSREDVDCRKRPHEARECAKVHSFLEFLQNRKTIQLKRNTDSICNMEDGIVRL